MLLQTNSYFVPTEKRAEHARLMRRFRATLQRLGCDHFEVYEQVGANWNPTRSNSRFIQLMRFRDRRHHQQIQAAERDDSTAQELIRAFVELIDLPSQQQQSLFDLGFYASVIASVAEEPAEAPAEDGQRPQLENLAEEAPASPPGDEIQLIKDGKSGEPGASDPV